MPAIRTALDALPEVFRTAVVLVDVEGQSYDEAAAVLGVPIGTVRSRLFRAAAPCRRTRSVRRTRDPGASCKARTGGQGGVRQNCEQVFRELWDYLDGELTDERMNECART